MAWFIAALGTAFFFSLSNTLDSFFTNKVFPSTRSIAFYSVCFNIVVIPIVFLVGSPDLTPPLGMLAIFALIGLFDVLYLAPYYRAMQIEDASIVTALFSLGRMYAPFLAYILVGEVVSLPQYLGFAMILAASVLLTLDFSEKRLRINRSFWYVLIAALLIYSEGSLYKYTFIRDTHWSTGIFWAAIFSMVWMGFTLVSARQRTAVREGVPALKKTFWLFSMEELSTAVAVMLLVYATSLAPITLVNGIVSVQPFIMLGLIPLLAPLFPHQAFREDRSRRHILKKLLLFVLMIAGVLLLGE